MVLSDYALLTVAESLSQDKFAPMFARLTGAAMSAFVYTTVNGV